MGLRHALAALLAALPFAACVVTMSYDDFGDQKIGTSDAGHVCVPKTCQDKNANCGDVPDDCSKVLNCGACANGETCGGAGPNRCGTGACQAETCASLSAFCGTASDGCGKTLECGGCTAPKTCGGVGVPNQCACPTLVTCESLQAECGQIDDGCGGTTDCGSCPLGKTCGGDVSTGRPNSGNTCVCEDPCIGFAYECGYATDCNVTSVFCPCANGSDCQFSGASDVGTCS